MFIVASLFVWFGVVMPLVHFSSRFELCDINITAPERLPQLDIHLVLSVYSAALVDVFASRADLSIVTGIHSKAIIPLKEEVAETVEYGALAACAIHDAALKAGQPSVVRIHCALSQQASAQTSVAEIINAFIDGAHPPLLSVRYRAVLRLLGVTIPMDGMRVVNVSKFAPHESEEPTLPSPPPTSPGGLQPPALPAWPPPAAPPAELQAQLCAAAYEHGLNRSKKFRFDALTLLSGGSAVAMPETYEEALALVKLCNVLFCYRPVPATSDALAPSRLASAEGNLSDAVTGSTSQTCAATPDASSGVLAFGVTIAAYNVLGLGAVATNLTIVIANATRVVLNGSSAAALAAPAWTGNAVTTVSRGGAVIACTLASSIVLPSHAWSAFIFDCAASTTTLPAIVGAYESGAESTLTATYALDVSAMGIALKRRGSIAGLKVIRSRVRALTGFGVHGSGSGNTGSRGPALPPRLSQCRSVSFDSAAARGLHAEKASAQINATVGALRTMMVEAGLIR